MTMSTGMRRTWPISVSSTRTISFPTSCFVEREIGDGRSASADEADFFLEQAVVELLVALSETAHVDVEVVNIRSGLFLDQVRELQRIHAADAGAILVVAFVPAADAVNDADALRWLAVASSGSGRRSDPRRCSFFRIRGRS